MKLTKVRVEDARALAIRKGILTEEMDDAMEYLLEHAAYRTGSDPERLNIDMDWEDAVAFALQEAAHD